MTFLKIIDRYLLRELAFPFIITVGGFMVIVELNIILQLSGFLIDKGVSLNVMARLLLYRLPDLLVFSLPVAMLFAIFLALGRLGHDRELIALQASGLSLKRLITPIIIAGMLVSGLAFLLEDQLAPWGNHQYWNLLRQLYLQRSVLRIEDNTFFKGPDERFFYVRHYDPDQHRLEGVLVYDLSGTLTSKELSNALPQIISADEATWEGRIWHLQHGSLYAFDRSGKLTFHDQFETMNIDVGDVQGLFLEQRTDQEMSLSELRARIAALHQSGLKAESLIVTYQSKIAIPLAAFVFALFGAPLSLLFGPRGRALGIVLGFALVNLYAGLLLWTQLLGNREVVSPDIAPWLPNIIFTLLGLYLFSLVDRVSRLDLIQKLRRWLPVLLLALALWACPAQAAEQTPSQRLPLELTADSLIVQSQGERMQADGHVQAHYSENTIQAQTLELSREPDGHWRLAAQGSVAFSNSNLHATSDRLNAQLRLDEQDQLAAQEITLSQSASVRYSEGQLSAQRLVLIRRSVAAEGWSVQALGDVRLEESPQNLTTRAQTLSLRFVQGPKGGLRAESAQVEDFTGATDFVNSEQQKHRLRYEGQRAQLRFDAQSRITEIDIARGNFTTCTCEAQIPQASYSISASRVLLYPNKLLVASEVTLRALGQPIFWMPLYLAPLEELQKNPLIPQFGSSAAQGWFVRWRIPFFASEGNYGAVLLDYFSRLGEVGSGLDLTYGIFLGQGSLSWYRLVGRSESFSLDWSHHWSGTPYKLPLQLDLSAGLRTGALARTEQPTKLLSQAALSGELVGWSWRAAWARDQYLLGAQTASLKPSELPSYRSLERLPELTLTRSGSLGTGPLSYRLSAAWGRYREEALDGSSRASTRFDGDVGTTLADLQLLSPGLRLSVNAGYRLSLYSQTARREAWEAEPTLNFSPTPGLTASLGYSYRMIQGSSLFHFDQLTLANLLSGQASWNVAGWRSALTGSYDVAGRRFTPAQLALGYQLGISDTSLTLIFDLNARRLITLSWSENVNWSPLNISLSSGYDLLQGRPDDLIAKFDFGEPLRVALDIDLSQRQLERVNLQSALSWQGWQLSFGGEFSSAQARFSALQIGIIHHFCHDCWQIGLYSDGHQIQIQAQINAFPMARLAYSPTDQRLSFGSQR
jgi:LPS export ABC transporter permease LptF